MNRKANAPSPRTRVRRLPDRAHYTPESVNSIVDDAYICTIAFSWKDSVHAIATAHWRQEGFLYIHGARASRMLEALEAGECCVTVTHLDGLVFARSAFHHSMNYRSAVIYGRFSAVEGDEKLAALATFIDQLAPGRWATLRPASDKEIYATRVLRISLSEASVKIRNWGVKDDEADLPWPVWAGVLPLHLASGAVQTDPLSVVGTPPDDIFQEP